VVIKAFFIKRVYAGGGSLNFDFRNTFAKHSKRIPFTVVAEISWTRAEVSPRFPHRYQNNTPYIATLISLYILQIEAYLIALF
jgi:hypothetical protein